MLEFLKGKKNHFIGIDFGTSSIKVVELSYKDQSSHLENYGVVDLNWAAQGDDARVKNSSFEQKLNEALKGLIASMNLKGGAAYVSVPGFSGLITLIELPEMAQEELAKAIQFEAHKYIPSSLDEIAMSWEVVERIDVCSVEEKRLGKIDCKKNKVLLVAAPKRDIERYDRLVSGTNLEVSAIELETFSIARALVGDDSGVYLIVDIGSRATNLILIEKNIVRANRNIDAGGNEITSAISDSMSISRARAEVFKKGEKDLLNSKESSLVIPVLELISGESKRILNTYKLNNREAKIEAVILSGGTSTMRGLEEYFKRSLGEKIVLGDPWKNISMQPNVAPLIKELGSSFTVALGLAQRGVEEYKRK